MYISIDLGGTNTRVASSKDLKSIHKIEKFLTQETVGKQKVLISQAVSKVVDGEKVERLCTGIPGTLDKKNKRFAEITNYEELNGLSFDEIFPEEFAGKGMHVENDAALAGLGEAVFGSGKDFTTMAYLTLSTGVGGIKITNKRLDQHQNISEPGHQIINLDGIEFKHGISGSLESYVSGASFFEIYKIKPENCNDEKIWTDYSSYLAAGINNIIVMWNPKVIVIGGGVSNKFELFHTPLINQLSVQTLFKAPPIKKAALKDDAGIFGGFAFISQCEKENI